MKEWIVVKVKIDVNTNTELSLRHGHMLLVNTGFFLALILILEEQVNLPHDKKNLFDRL